MILLIAIILLITLFYALFHTDIITKLRTDLFYGTAFLGFQFDRVYWLYPTLWYVAFGLSLSLIYNSLKKYKKISVLVVAFLSLVPSHYVVKNSDITQNIVHEKSNNDIALSQLNFRRWKSVFDEDLFKEIKSFIAKPQNEYYVISLGLEPNILLYNGFNCLDGYSNNYNFEYKKCFGKMMLEELMRNRNNYDYFWNWGNRCYLFSGELGRNTFVSKMDNISVNIEINVKNLRKIGCNYVFSTLNIENASEIGLSLLDYFSNSDSYYGIYLYSVE